MPPGVIAVAGSELAVKSKNITLLAMLLAVSMTFIDTTIVAIASPHLQAELQLSRFQTQWVVNSYLLALAATFALGGRLADVYGSRRMALIGIVGFVVSSALCGATPKGSYAEAWIVTFRATQGVFAALMFPAALAVLVATFPLQERGRALAIFFAATGAFTSVGPILGGILTQWTWRAIFWVNVPVGIAAVLVTLAAGVSNRTRNEPVDWRGALVIAAGMALSVLGFQQAPEWGWGNVATWLCIVGGLVVLAAFVRLEVRTPVPLLKLQIFRDRAFTVDNGVLFFSMMAFVPVFFFASVYAQVSLGYSATNAGLYLLLFFAGFSVAAQIGGRILDKRGAKGALVVGSLIGAIGFAWWGRQTTHLSLNSQWHAVVIAGAGIGLLLGPASTDAVNRAIGATYGEATGINQTVRNYGSALGFAVLGTVLSTVLTHRLTNSLTGLGVPHDVAARVATDTSRSGSSSGNTAPEALRGAIDQAVVHDFAVATQWVLYAMAVALLVGFLVSLAHPGGKVEVTPEVPQRVGPDERVPA